LFKKESIFIFHLFQFY